MYLGLLRGATPQATKRLCDTTSRGGGGVGGDDVTCSAFRNCDGAALSWASRTAATSLLLSSLGYVELKRYRTVGHKLPWTSRSSFSTSFVRSFVHPFIYSFFHSFIHSYIPSSFFRLTDAFLHSVMASFMRLFRTSVATATTLLQ